MGLGRRLARMTRGPGRLRFLLILSAPTAWLVAFLILPLAFVAVYGFSWYNDSYLLQVWPLQAANYVDALRVDANAIILPLLFKTFGVALAVTLVSLVIGYAMAYYIARIAKEKHRGLLMGLIVIPFWVSFIVRILAVLMVTNGAADIHVWMREHGLGPLSSAITDFFQIGTFQMVVFTLMYVWLPFMILPLFASLSKLDPQLLEAAYDLGASRWRAFYNVTLPLTYPAMVVGSILIFITSVGAFVELEFVGGREWIQIGNYIQTQFNVIGGLPQASASALFLILVTVLLISVYRRYSEIGELGESEARSRLLAPLWSFLKGHLRPPRAEKPIPRAPTMQDGGTALPAPLPYAVKGMGAIHRAPWERALDVVAEKAGKYILGGVTYLMLLLFFVPLLVVALFSFNNLDSLNHLGGFSLEWWVGSPTRDGLLTDPLVKDAIFYSFFIAFLSSMLAVIIGMMAAFAITRYRFRTSGILKTTMYTGLVIPSLILGISIAILIRFLNQYLLAPLSLGYEQAFGITSPAPLQWELGLASVVVGHTTFNIPLATLVLTISFREFDRTLEEASMNLGADELNTFFRVTLPNIVPGIISAILLGFTFSFDELPVTLFLYGAPVVTLPVFIYGLISKKIISPRVNAASTVVLGLSFILIVVTNRLVRRGGNLFRI